MTFLLRRRRGCVNSLIIATLKWLDKKCASYCGPIYRRAKRRRYSFTL